MVLHYDGKIHLFKWLSYLFVSILCCIAAAGQGKEVQTLLISQEDLDSKLPSASELRTHFDLKEDDLFHIKTDDFFPKKLEKSFQKHRWKFNVKDFSFTPLDNVVISKSSSVPISTLGNSSSQNTSKSSATFAFHENEDYDANQNDGHEDDDDDEILNTMNLNDIEKMKPKIKIQNQTELIGPELMMTPNNDRKIYSEQHKNYNYIPSQLPRDTLSSPLPPSAPGDTDTDPKMKDHAELELFKISTKNQSQNDNNFFMGPQGVTPFPSSTFPQSDPLDGEQGTESIRIIPQLVNVTTENVYVSLESDEEGDEDDTLAILNKSPSKNNHQPNSIGIEDQLELAEFSSVSTEPPFITVNSSGIFPQSNLSSNFRDKLSKFYKRKHQNHYHKGSIFQEAIAENNNETISDNQEFSDDENSNELSKNEDSSSDEEEDDGSGKTMMMRRRPRRSVVHLYDMVVCATGCNPLIYKGYGCFCGFMGSGITVDGIDKCCYKHDWCYHHAKCPPLLTYFVPYYWTCNGGRPKCVSDFRGWKGICGAHLCECDRQFAECLRKYPCPRTRAMCMTSPWRFWQNIIVNVR